MHTTATACTSIPTYPVEIKVRLQSLGAEEHAEDLLALLNVRQVHQQTLQGVRTRTGQQLVTGQQWELKDTGTEPNTDRAKHYQ